MVGSIEIETTSFALTDSTEWNADRTVPVLGPTLQYALLTVPWIPASAGIAHRIGARPGPKALSSFRRRPEFSLTDNGKISGADLSVPEDNTPAGFVSTCPQAS